MIKDGINYTRILHAAIFTPMGRSKHRDYRHEIDWGQRLMLLGAPGVGKTETIMALAASLGAEFLSFKPGVKGEGGVGVVPTRAERIVKVGATKKKQDVITFPAPDWVLNLNEVVEHSIGIVAVDEFTTADGRVQGGMLGGVQEKEWGSTHLRGRIRVLGMGNEVIDTPGGWDPAPSVANRFCWIPWPEQDPEEWGDQLMTDFAQAIPMSTEDPLDIEARVLDAWPSAWVRAAAVVRGYTRRVGKLLDQPKPGDPQAHRGWASPRSLRSSTACLAAAEIHGLTSEETALMLRGYVGEGWAREIMEHKRAMALVDPLDWLDGKESFKHDPTRVDVTLTLLHASAALLAAVPKSDDERERTSLEAKRTKRAERWWQFVGAHLHEGLADPVSDLAGSTMLRAGLVTPSARAVITAINPLVNATRSSR